MITEAMTLEEAAQRLFPEAREAARMHAELGLFADELVGELRQRGLQLTPTETRAFSMLIRQYPEVCTHPQLRSTVSRSHYEIRSSMRELRRKLENAGLDRTYVVTIISGFGYVLELPGMPTSHVSHPEFRSASPNEEDNSMAERLRQTPPHEAPDTISLAAILRLNNIQVPPRCVNALAALLQADGRIVSREELCRKAWRIDSYKAHPNPDYVMRNGLSNALCILRRGIEGRPINGWLYETSTILGGLGYCIRATPARSA